MTRKRGYYEFLACFNHYFFTKHRHLDLTPQNKLVLKPLCLKILDNNEC